MARRMLAGTEMDMIAHRSRDAFPCVTRLSMRVEQAGGRSRTDAMVVRVRRHPVWGPRSVRSTANAGTRTAHDVAGGARGRKSPPPPASAARARTTSVPGATVRRGADASDCASPRTKLAQAAWHSAQSAGWMRAHAPFVRVSMCAATTPRSADSRSSVASAHAATPGSAICTEERTRISQRDAMERRVTNPRVVMPRRTRSAVQYPLKPKWFSREGPADREVSWRGVQRCATIRQCDARCSPSPLAWSAC